MIATLLWRNANKNANIIYDKDLRKSKFILEFNEGVIFKPDNGAEIIVTDEYVLLCSQWVDLEKRINKEMQDDKNKEIFEKLMKSTMELNPVLIKYWFK